MNHKNGEVPDNLGRLGDLLPADVLKMLNELLEQLQQSGHTSQGNKIELVYHIPPNIPYTYPLCMGGKCSCYFVPLPP